MKPKTKKRLPQIAPHISGGLFIRNAKTNEMQYIYRFNELPLKVQVAFINYLPENIETIQDIINHYYEIDGAIFCRLTELNSFILTHQILVA